MCLLTSNTSKIPGKLRAAWRTESGELFFNIQLPSASHRFPALPSIFFMYFLQFLRPLFQSPSGSFCPFLLPSGCFCLLELLRPFQLPAAFPLPSTLQLPSASFSFLWLPPASSASFWLPAPDPDPDSEVPYTPRPLSPWTTWRVFIPFMKIRLNRRPNSTVNPLLKSIL